MKADNDNTLPVTRAEAREKGSKHYFTGKPCVRGHIDMRTTRDAICVECNRERARSFVKKFPEKKKAQDRARYWATVETRRQYGREYSALHADEAGERAKLWRLNNPERAAHNDRIKRARKRGAEGTHTAKEIAALIKKQNYRCVYCGTSIRKKENRHVDHIMPLKLGGANDITNIQILCPTCNMSKKAMHPVDYAQRIGLLV